MGHPRGRRARRGFQSAAIAFVETPLPPHWLLAIHEDVHSFADPLVKMTHHERFSTLGPVREFIGCEDEMGVLEDLQSGSAGRGAVLNLLQDSVRAGPCGAEALGGKALQRPSDLRLKAALVLRIIQPDVFNSVAQVLQFPCRVAHRCEEKEGALDVGSHMLRFLGDFEHQHRIGFRVE